MTRVALVTGSGRGIGRGIACRLAADGRIVAVADLDAALAAETVGIVESAGGRAYAVEMDVTSTVSVEKAVAELKSALASEDAEEIKAKSQALAQASMKLGEAMYKAQQEQAAPGGPEAGAAGGAAHDDSVVDADFTEVDEGDKKAS